MKKNNLMFVVCIFLLCGGLAQAAIVDISVATDKSVYQLGDNMTISITAYNSGSESVTLKFGSTMQASYLMDNTFDWTKGKTYATVLTSVTIAAGDSYTWTLSYGTKEMAYYTLDIGSHAVVGEVLGYDSSSPVEFIVIPEPATLLVFSIGLPIFRIFSKRKF